MNENEEFEFRHRLEVESASKAPALPAAAPLSRTDKFIKGLRDPIDGGAQLLANILPDGMVKAGNKVNNWLADNTGMVGRLPEGGVDQQVRDGEKAYQASRAAGGESGIDGYRLAGNVLNPTNLAMASKAPQAATLAARVLGGVEIGAASGALSPVAEGNFGSEKLKQMAIGAGAGAAMPVVTNALGRMISPNSTRNPNLQLLQSEGVTPTVGQTLGGRWNALEEKLQSIPILGDAISNARGRSLQDFNNAAINRASGKIGAKVEGTGQKAVAEAGDKLSAAYDNLLPRMNWTPDAQFAGEFGNLRQMAASGLAPKEAARFDSLLSEHMSKLSPNGSMTGETFKTVESALSKDVAKFSGSTDAYQKELGDALAETLRIFKQTLSRSNPTLAGELGDINAGWANLVRIEGAAKAGKNAEGLFTPAQLNMAVQGADQSVRKRAVSRGNALMQDLGNAGQAVIGNKVPNSFTTDRALLAGGTLGSYFVNPAIPAGLMGGAAAYSRPGQNMLNALVGSRPQAAQPIANALNKYSPALIPLASQVGLGFSK